VAGGYLANHYPPRLAFQLDAATFAISAGFLLFVRPPATPQGEDGGPSPMSAFRDIRDGIGYARGHRRVLELLAVAALVWFCGPLVSSVTPAIVRDVYGGDYQSISSFRAFLGLGFVAGAILISVLGDALRSEIAMTWGLFGISAGIGVVTTSVFLPCGPATLYWIGAVGTVLAGIFAIGVMASFNSLLQRTTANRFRGRVFGLNDLCTITSLLLATGLLGVPSWERVDRWVGYILFGVTVATFIAGSVTLNVRLARGSLGKGVTFAQHLNEFVAKYWWRLRLVGRSRVPRTGPVIIAANHTCSVDPLLLCAVTPFRTIAFLVAAEFSELPVARYFLRLVDCIPVRRGETDPSAVKAALRHLQRGGALGIFIEGRIVPPGESAEPKDGAASLALRSGAMVLPAFIRGTQYTDNILRGLLSRYRAEVRFGKPVDLSDLAGNRRDRNIVKEATARIYAAIRALEDADVPGRSRPGDPSAA